MFLLLSNTIFKPSLKKVYQDKAVHLFLKDVLYIIFRKDNALFMAIEAIHGEWRSSSFGRPPYWVLFYVGKDRNLN